ncbi:hypothetical protein COW99_04770 [Candidatus Roizmanbacteria bacterium CG22_combo_CG10-13_8_21_14_all_38_20]|uniref:Phosphoribosyltransferase domain-containing protein n=1 Tax=Candidatus Roizmanbacteria bacterium CG22_combo_CG10-13_8_21_14_all_38_20 TaxID=1974862 RepID=A0A2H0BWE2_9BACT|nr:hypothetical protein [Candidatus Microgenomates bacterium]PIP61298.1 MAG: hypothetical protein COW99_04770 [Candidatus Roizmanbacteria bacterium CG22_combo_CG10-13_8_21_14_all_38_20]PJC30630.1 MAG: hypothetical protein CO050_05975 [Candidatus Roizmanbacteria bacterium CG_4_9_14_0_2_um_filter_38_17]
MLERKNLVQPESTEVLTSVPYVVSGDIKILLENWADQRGFVLPEASFFVDLRANFSSYMQQMFGGFELVSEIELVNGMAKQVESTGLPAISLDRVYFRSESFLDITRQVENTGKDKGLGRRMGSPTLLQQFRALREQNISKVTLVDDVIFAGEQVTRISKMLERIGISVPVVCAGIGIGEGIEQLNNLGQEVRCVRQYKDVIDEICERDFYPGVPMCGRSIQGDNNIGVPYILPLGNPGKWASIPDQWQAPFSGFCIQQTVKLFEAIEIASGKEVQCRDLERKVFSLPNDGTRFVDALVNL